MKPMKIIKTPTPIKTTREQWIQRFLAHFPDHKKPREVPTGYRDLGGAVRFAFATGHEIEWLWQRVAPMDAANGAMVVMAGYEADRT